MSSTLTISSKPIACSNSQESRNDVDDSPSSSLFFIRLEDLHLHEDYRPSREEQLVSRINTDGFLANPLIASQVRNRVFVLDGHHRCGCLRRMGCSDACEEALNVTLLDLPNVPHPTVPPGKDNTCSQEIRRWGAPVLPVAEPKPHWEIGAEFGLDIERGTKLAGSRFYALRGQIALLELALIQFMIDMHVHQHDYELVIPPFLVNRDAMTGCGQLPKFQDELHRTQDDLYLVPTARAPWPLYTAMKSCRPRNCRRNTSALRPASAAKPALPGVTPAESCGSTSSTRSSCSNSTRRSSPTTNWKASWPTPKPSCRPSSFPTELSYCGRRHGLRGSQDLEVWLPSENRCREISSCSNVEAFQARRTNTRYRPGPQGKPRHVHMPNGSGLAVGRTMIALLENHQQRDGTVSNVLRRLMPDGRHQIRTVDI